MVTSKIKKGFIELNYNILQEFVNINNMSDNIRKNFAGGLRPGAVVEVKIGGYTHEGWGVARLGGRVIFVKGALRDEEVRVEIYGERRGVFYARLLAVLKPGERRLPECPVYEQCGGCQLQHMSYDEELVFKAEQVRAAIYRIGGFGDFIQRPIWGAAQIYHYRNKGIFHVSRNKSGQQLGFWDESSHQPAGAACTLLFPPSFARTLAMLQKKNLPEQVQNVLVRYSRAQDKLLLAVEIDRAEAISDCRKYLQQLAAEMPELAVWGVKLGADYKIFSPEKFLVDKLGDTEYQIAPGAFFQVNNDQTLRLLAAVREALGDDCRVLLDIYCGIGTFGLYLAKNLPGLTHLAGIEQNAAAVTMAKANGERNGIGKAVFLQGRAEDRFAGLRAHYKQIDGVIIDPPRRGCDKGFLGELLALGPSKIVYVSCNPASLARDLKILCAGGYSLDFVQPVDMFPRTHHVECVVSLSHKN